MRFISTNLRRSALVVFGTAVLGCLHSSAVFADQEPDYEDWNAKFQSTYNWQRHPGFRSAYSGTNSLDARAETMYTFSATAMIGVRPWTGGEVFLNAEAVQGVPFTGNLVGLGGFTNGEITRAAGNEIKVYRQRLFLRQTWNQGGGSEQLESGQNQLAGSVDKNRTVLTIGNFSSLDVFDGNAYAKDPRTQFMNWSNWTYAAYDYAADARGFGWGFALEWYRNDWVWRIGRMSGPEVPNGLPVDLALGKHFGDQAEVEHAHTLFDQPGKVRVLVWRNRAVLASYSDALAYLVAHPGTDPQTFFKVRGGERNKYGIGINLEQAVNDDVGLFLRAMKTDGKTETQAFTEVDGSLSLGMTLKATALGRSQDTVGLAFARNTLSDDRRRFLAAGGISFFIGDGALHYGPETILETYYNLDVGHGAHITADYQRIKNPAYNVDRGPVDVYALRLHTEF